MSISYINANILHDFRMHALSLSRHLRARTCVISLAVGLSIDFSIHYGVGFKLTTSEQRRDRVHEVLATIGSAVAMAALTTFSAGISVSFGLLVIYLHFGTFLMLVMVSSWFFGTFFLMPLLSVIGPRKARFILLTPSVSD